MQLHASKQFADRADELYSDETYSGIFCCGWWSRRPRCKTTKHTRSISQELIRFGALWEDIWHSWMLMSKHVEVVGCSCTAASLFLCHMGIPGCFVTTLTFFDCMYFFFFFKESHPLRTNCPLSLSQTFGTSLIRGTNERDNCGKGLHNIAVSHVSCFSVRELKFSTNACFNLLPRCSGIWDKLLALFVWVVSLGKFTRFIRVCCCGLHNRVSFAYA